MSSFYEYAIRMGVLDANLTDRVKRPKTQQYATPTALDPDEIDQRMQQIDRQMLLGKRDYALLAVAPTTGRRLSAMAGLRWKDVHSTGEVVTLTFHEKGGKVMRDELARPITQAFLSWLRAYFGTALGNLSADAPIWVSLDNHTKGGALGIQSLADIAEKRLGVTKFHTLCHTFARRMDKRGARLTEIQARLGHTDAKTTGMYLTQLSSAENPHAAGLAADFGFLDDEE